MLISIFETKSFLGKRHFSFSKDKMKSKWLGKALFSCTQVAPKNL